MSETYFSKLGVFLKIGIICNIKKNRHLVKNLERGNHEKTKTNQTFSINNYSINASSNFQLPVMADTKDNVILEKAEGYLIYYKDICNNEFEFAFSNDSAENVENLVFKSSAKDSTSEGALNIAYVNQALKDTYFNDVTKSTYLWIRNLNDEMLVTADKVD